MVLRRDDHDAMTTHLRARLRDAFVDDNGNRPAARLGGDGDPEPAGGTVISGNNNTVTINTTVLIGGKCGGINRSDGDGADR